MRKGKVDLFCCGVKAGKSSFDLVVTERIQTQPEFRKEILREVIEHISSDDLLVAKKMLDQVIEADEGVDK